MAGEVVLLLGGGRQGRAVLEDLERRSDVETVAAADRDVAALEAWGDSFGAKKVVTRRLDARDDGELRALVADGFDVVIDMLPVSFATPVTRAAIDVGVHLVNTNYGHEFRDLDAEARARGVTVMPEAGLDPGIDLVIAGRAVSSFDRVEALLSYGGGIPAPECKDANLLRYKVSWTFDGVLRSYRRSARVLVDGVEVDARADEIFEPRWTHEIEFGELGGMEAYVNGDAVAFAEILGIRGSVRTMGRYALRWPGHCEFWRRIAALGLLDDSVPEGRETSPREFLRRQLEPRLQYADDERDMVVLRVEAVGRKGGKKCARRWDLVDYRDLETGLMAMNRTVGYPASIVAQMILSGKVTRRGVASPARDVPAEAFFGELARRGITVEETEIDPAECFSPSGSGSTG